VPEGDSLHNLATRLRPALVGATLRSLRVPEASGPPPATGSHIDAVEARGKYLRIRFDCGIELQTHLQMNGRWILQRADAPRRYAEHLARVVLETDEHLAVCLRAPVVRLVRVAASSTIEDVPRSLAHLGPDLCRPDADLDAAVARLGTHASPEAEIGDALLDQRVMAGVGNVFKSEVLFACAVDPFRTLATIDETLRERIVRTAARQLRANLRPGRRTTVPGGYAVYGRARQPCPRCTTLIEARRQGRDARITYWCPRCQR
jgi:endonuclease-8